MRGWRLPPPTENTSTPSLAVSRLARSQPDQRLVPPFVIDAGGEFGDVVRRRVGLEAGELAEVADRVRRVRGAAAVADDEQPAAAGTIAASRAATRSTASASIAWAIRASRPDDHARTSASFPAWPSSRRHRRHSVLPTSFTFFHRKALLFPAVRSVRSIGTSISVWVRASALTSTSA